MIKKYFNKKLVMSVEHERSSAQWSGNLELTKKVPVTIHNLKGYDSHLIMQQIGKFDVKYR